MREDCKYFQVRAYPSGESVRFCALNLAPEAPWRCPAGCPRYTRRTSDLPSAGSGAGVPEPDLHPHAVELLASAGDIINAVGPEILAEQERQQREEERRQQTLWNRLKHHSSRWRR